VFILALSQRIWLALDTIRNHKLRAFLTVLGVIIGTGTIIGVSAILTGFDASITGRAAQLRAEFHHRLQVPRGPARQQPDARGAHPQGPHLRKRHRHPRPVQGRGGRLAHAVPQQDTINVPITRATTCTTSI
jgi:ABC-type antimicrobial peptide transport system permease subunit